MIDLLRVYNHIDTYKNIKEDITISKDYYKNSDIINLKEVNVSIDIHINDEDIYVANGSIKSSMLLIDAVTLEEVWYDFNKVFEDEELDNDIVENNSLDLLEFVWQYIVLEIPIRFTKVKELSEISQEDYELVNTSKKKTTNSPFKDLASRLREE